MLPYLEINTLKSFDFARVQGLVPSFHENDTEFIIKLNRVLSCAARTFNRSHLLWINEHNAFLCSGCNIHVYVTNSKQLINLLNTLYRIELLCILSPLSFTVSAKNGNIHIYQVDDFNSKSCLMLQSVCYPHAEV